MVLITKMSLSFYIIHLLIFSLISTCVICNQAEDNLLQGLNSYRTAQRVPPFAKNEKADCVADEIADKLEDQPCTNHTTASTVTPGSVPPRLTNYQDILSECKVDPNTTRDALILPVCIPNRIPTLALTNYTQTGYARYLNDSRTIKDARKLPVINMLEEVKRSCMKRISKLCDKTKKCKTRYEVLEGSGSYSVNLLTRECACCRQWNLTGIPCPHAIFVIREKNRDPEDYVDRHLATHVWKATYKDNIEPDDDDPWSIHNAPKRWRNAQSQSTPLVAQSQSIPACSQNQFTQNSQHSSAPTANPSGRGRAHGRPSGVKNGQGKGKGKGRGKGSDEAPRPPVFFMSP
ncbi:unnamed protein product [Arabidopsis arenosa]|uniref:SWIM-type domain-containing protein n=1 Tax=Arabidopsis arenosa TaxID=38785 RepID=A0A8S1ZLR3_ARAAE|nr:unnamed protein product [Arabidopsis arenosa]